MLRAFSAVGLIVCGCSGSSSDAVTPHVAGGSGSSAGTAAAGANSIAGGGLGGASAQGGGAGTALAGGVANGGSAPLGGAAGGGASGGAGENQGGQPEPPTSSFLYVSGYSPQISVFALNHATGAVTNGALVDAGAGSEPTALVFSPDKRFAYANNEQKTGPASGVIAFTIEPKDGVLKEINRQNSGSSIGAHVSVHPSGKWVLSANYGGGSVTVYPVRADGGLAPAMTPVPAGALAHQVLFDSTGTVLFVPCMKAGYIAVYHFDAGALTPHAPPTVAVPGDPRNMAFTPDERFGYVLTQDASTITALSFDRATTTLTPIQTLPATPNGPSISAHLEMHPSGKFLYAANRADNSVGIFSIDPVTGKLTEKGQQREKLNFPRGFGIDPTGQLLIVGNEQGNDIQVHRIDAATGLLQTVGDAVGVAKQPTFVGALAIP